MVEKLFACSVCDYVYKDMATAEMCEAYCRAHNACSTEITSKAIGKTNSGA